MDENQTHTDVEKLESNQCLELLRAVSVGHLAVSSNDMPQIFPVNFTIDHGTVVFRTGEGTKLKTLRAQPRVAFQADGVNQETGVAWSVMVQGEAELFGGIEETLDSFNLMLFPWESGPKDQFVRIVPTSMTGRRFKVADPLTWWKHMRHG
ncbi:pyridoxamine 5'-phosphate oxidase family protein [Paeniglutamicibacter gangotriensis]|uniref:Pyridoxamine 5'-phosphate oxidase family protein n=1 Tax=Paeniglutamicibacter gangotriensis TaxID=254787 RepID=A0A5B0EHV5_9MICC|nr:pyridoxamine 5'-phosphate oxidase family protein [Paeniglutamicibacter gangotriensis]KAA0978627.1 pyridoxamine 5'-phosphate oxidase family protein [Paeniglutamicibacter gangotriensis]